MRRPTDRPGESKKSPVLSRPPQKIEARQSENFYEEKKTSKNSERKQPRFAQKERNKEQAQVMSDVLQ